MGLLGLGLGLGLALGVEWRYPHPHVAAMNDILEIATSADIPSLFRQSSHQPQIQAFEPKE